MDYLSKLNYYYRQYIRAVSLLFFTALIFLASIITNLSLFQNESYFYVFLVTLFIIGIIAYLRACYCVYKMFAEKYHGIGSMIYLGFFNSFIVKMMKDLVIKKEKDPLYKPKSFFERSCNRYYKNKT